MKPHLQKRQDWIRGRREKRKLARQARLRRQLFRYTVLTLLSLVAVAGFVYLPWSISQTDRDIVIHGNHVVTDEQVRGALITATNQPLYRLNPAKLESAVVALPAVKYAFVRRAVLPRPKLKVEVLEEFPWASYCLSADSEPTAVISQSGRLIPIKDFPAVVQPPLKFCGGADFKLSAAQIAQWDSWVHLIADELGHPVDMVDMSQPSKIAVTCGDTQLHIGQADSTLTRRLSRIASVLPVASALHDHLKFIDLSLDSNIPLKVDRTTTTAAKDDELLKQAVRALASSH